MKYFKINTENQNIVIECINKWSMYDAKNISNEITDIKQKYQSVKELIIDINNLADIDTASTVLLYEFLDELRKTSNVQILDNKDKQKKFIKFVQDSISEEKGKQHIIRPLNFIERLGRYAIDSLRDFWLFLAFTGESFSSLLVYLLHPSNIRFKAIVKNIQNAGVNAVPIIILTSFLVGVVVAYQSAVQLQKFGANIFIVDMIGISITRELAPLITAIVVAGRSGSSYTAQIGAMRITRELDAMDSMGFNLFEFLVLPRVIALMIALPLLIFFADIVGIFGGMVVAKYQINISYLEFIKRLQSVLALKQLWIGLAKGPIFALLIAGIGCFRGFQVSSSTESIGKYTTISVVNAIFLVIACDALFSIILTKLGM